ncbi:hypothetical protein HZB04_00600 [Candidatus Wolfebacteria bacterium]|nr:hypothetical protein [Candidatus Wolfebacteria bacterium]
MNYEERIKILKKLADEDKLSHAYLFFGEAKNEKLFFAECLANYLEKGEFKKPEKILEETLIISPNEKENIGIDKIREISNFLYQKTVFSKKRTVIINKSGAMSLEAQNAALKITEESPPQTLIIFISQNEDSLLPALASRLQKIYFPGAKSKITANPQLLREKIDKIIENDIINDYFETLIIELRKNPIKNSERLAETLKILTRLKMFNVNKKLQLKTLCLF